MALRNEKLPAQIPAELNKWNWGAFLLNWIWGIGNSTYIAFLMFVPFVNLVMPFVLGAKGSRWAWENNYWKDEAHFKSTQRKWSIAGFAVFALFIALAIGIMSMVFGLMKNSDAYAMTMRAVGSNQQVVQALGTPIKEGYFPSGSINLKGSNGTAKLTISLSGSKANGKAYSRAIKRNGVWTILLLYVVVDGQKQPIVITNKNNVPIPGMGIGT